MNAPKPKPDWRTLEVLEHPRRVERAFHLRASGEKLARFLEPQVAITP